MRLTLIDDLARKDHYYLQPQDSVLFYGEYTARAGYASSPTNNLISNLKKAPTKKGKPEYRWKERAIDQCAEILRSTLKREKLAEDGFVVVPAPPSNRPDHPEYDDRMIQIARKFCAGSHLDCRDLLVTTEDRPPMHVSDAKRDPNRLRQTIRVNESCVEPTPQRVLLVDDVLTTGCTFKVCGAILKERFPGIAVAGVFIARRVSPHVPEEFQPIDLDDVL